MDLSFWNGFMTGPAYQGVAMDHHSYGVFSEQDLAKTWDQHIAARSFLLLSSDHVDLGTLICLLWLAVPAVLTCFVGQ